MLRLFDVIGTSFSKQLNTGIQEGSLRKGGKKYTQIEEKIDISILKED